MVEAQRRTLPRALRLAIRIAVSGALLALLATLSDLRLGQPPTHGLLRIALRVPVASVRSCRALTAEQIAALPAHMRHTEECDTRALPYRLRVAVDERGILDHTVSARGIRGDRPLVIDEDLPLAPGRRRISVELAPQGEGPAAPPPLDATLDVERGRIVLVELDSEAARLVLTNLGR